MFAQYHHIVVLLSGFFLFQNNQMLTFDNVCSLHENFQYSIKISWLERISNKIKMSPYDKLKTCQKHVEGSWRQHIFSYLRLTVSNFL